MNDRPSGHVLNGLVAMCLGWKWRLSDDGRGRYLIDDERACKFPGVSDPRPVAKKSDPLLVDEGNPTLWAHYVPSYSLYYSEKWTGDAFIAAQQADLFKGRCFGSIEKDGEVWQLKEDGVLLVSAANPCYCICMGILRDNMDKLADFEEYFESFEGT